MITHNAQAHALAEKSLNDSKPEVRAAAATALGGMSATSSVPLVMNLLKDTDVGVVMAAARALLDLKQEAAYEVYYAVLAGERKSGAGLMASAHRGQ